MELNILFAAISVFFSAASSILFLVGVLTKKIKPHVFTFLIWAITQGTAVAGILIGGGGIGVLGPLVGEIFIIAVFILSFWYGSKNITKSDIILLVIAVSAIIIWWLVDNPLYAVLLVVLIDIVGYLPTIRKTYVDPSSEKAMLWLFGTANYTFTLLALEQYSLLTVSYPVALAIGNTTVAMTWWLRKDVKK